MIRVDPAVLRFITARAWPPLSLCTRCKASIKTWLLAQHQLRTKLSPRRNSFQTFAIDAVAAVDKLESMCPWPQWPRRGERQEVRR
jgi:hypothetical protein